MLKQILIILPVGIMLGVVGSFLYFQSKIAEYEAEELRIETFSECVEDKIEGAGTYAELMTMDVLDCADLILNEE